MFLLQSGPNAILIIQTLFKFKYILKYYSNSQLCKIKRSEKYNWDLNYMSNCGENNVGY